MKRTIQEQRDKLTNEQRQLQNKWVPLNAEFQKDQRRVTAISNELLRLDFVELVGKPGAVKLRYQERLGGRYAVLNDKAGTVLAVRRTRVTVDFGDAGRWNWPLFDLLPTDKSQGELLNLGAP